MRRQEGFTLIELLVAASLMIVVISTTLFAFERFQFTTDKNQSQNDSQERVRSTLDKMARDLRGAAAFSADKPQGFAKATATDVVFQAVDTTGASGGQNVRHAMWTRYCLDTSIATNEKLYRQAWTWTGATSPNPPSTAICPDPGWSQTAAVLVADRIVNYDNRSKPVFYYSPAPAGASATQAEMDRIARLRVDLFVDADVKRSPGATELDTGVYLRNQ